MYPVWDVPTRLFHWLLVIAFLLSWLSHEYDWYRIHLWSGYTVLVLVAFRLAWGFVGSPHSLFRDFLHGPGRVLGYFRGEGRVHRGHNPAGGWVVLAMLLLLLAQALTGLFNSDGLLFNGPLYHTLDSGWTDRLGAWHGYLFRGLATVVVIHVLAIVIYQVLLRRNLLGPMFSGGDKGVAAPVSVWRALAIVLLCAATLALAVYLAPEPDLPW